MHVLRKIPRSLVWLALCGLGACGTSPAVRSLVVDGVVGGHDVILRLDVIGDRCLFSAAVGPYETHVPVPCPGVGPSPSQPGQPEGGDPLLEEAL